jgi:cytochrome c553
LVHDQRDHHCCDCFGSRRFRIRLAAADGPHTSFSSVWEAICSAAGITQTGPAPTIVESGAPMRGIAPCGACHGEKGHKLGAPWLEGQSVPDLRGQLLAFKNGDRHNDNDNAMRNVARPMTPEEIDAAAGYYGVNPYRLWFPSWPQVAATRVAPWRSVTPASRVPPSQGSR